MPESPDFHQIARVLLAQVADAGQRGLDAEVNAVAEQLRLIWNARGAADIARLKNNFPAVLGSTAAGLSMKILDRALRTLDR